MERVYFEYIKETIRLEQKEEEKAKKKEEGTTNKEKEEEANNEKEAKTGKIKWDKKKALVRLDTCNIY